MKALKVSLIVLLVAALSSCASTARVGGGVSAGVYRPYGGYRWATPSPIIVKPRPVVIVRTPRVHTYPRRW
ncbi:MAG: hypothetical protein U0Y10_03830 [Spirosomataceae bacterium]